MIYEKCWEVGISYLLILEVDLGRSFLDGKIDLSLFLMGVHLTRVWGLHSPLMNWD